ncbi:MAG: hypothetical protein KC468_07440 [Myxococcales bacterium]|nr:hypothetical protein [Myxococcales bacterium]
MPSEVKIWLPSSGADAVAQTEDVALTGVVVAAGTSAATSFEQARGDAGAQLLCGGARAFHLRVDEALGADGRARLRSAVGRRLLLEFGDGAGLRCRLREADGQGLAGDERPAINLTEGMFGAAPLLLREDGTLAGEGGQPAPRGLDALDVMVNAARWVSSRRTTTFEQLFPTSAFHPEQAPRDERLTTAQGAGLLAQLRAILAAASPSREEARAAGIDAVQLRSAALTVLSHLLATVLKDPEFRALADAAAEAIFGLIDDEVGEGARAELRETALALWRQRWRLVEDELSEGPYLLGARFCVADIYLAALSRWDMPRAWRLEHLPKLERLADTVASRPRLRELWPRHFKG